MWNRNRSFLRGGYAGEGERAIDRSAVEHQLQQRSPVFQLGQHARLPGLGADAGGYRTRHAGLRADVAVAVGIDQPELEVRFRRARRLRVGLADDSGERGSVDTPVDTQLSGTVTYNGLTGFQPYFSMLINAPTGKSALYNNARFARMDGDLVDQGSYGEGWNFGPTAGVNIPLSQSLILTLSAGYTQRNPYAKESQNPFTGLVTDTVSVKNGDEATATAALGYAQGALSLQGSASLFVRPDFAIEPVRFAGLQSLPRRPAHHDFRQRFVCFRCDVVGVRQRLLDPHREE